MNLDNSIAQLPEDKFLVAEWKSGSVSLSLVDGPLVWRRAGKFQSAKNKNFKIMAKRALK